MCLETVKNGRSFRWLNGSVELFSPAQCVGAHALIAADDMFIGG